MKVTGPMSVLMCALPLLAFSAGPAASGSDLELAADVRGAGQPFAAGVRMLDGGDIAVAARAAWLAALKTETAECGVTTVRLRPPGGENFFLLDDVLDRVIAMGVRPALVLDDAVSPARLQHHLEERYTTEERRQWKPLSAARGSRPRAPDFACDVLPAAVYLLEGALAVDPGVCDDPEASHSGDPGIFQGGAGLMTFQGVVKPLFHACRMLQTLGDEVVARRSGGIVTRRRTSGRVIALVYNLPSGAPARLPHFADLASAEKFAASGGPKVINLSLSGLQPGGQVLVETIDVGHGNAVGAWRSLGAPAAPGRGALDALRVQARAGAVEFRQADDAGHFADSRTLGPWAFVLFREL